MISAIQNTVGDARHEDAVVLWSATIASRRYALVGDAMGTATRHLLATGQVIGIVHSC